MTESPANPADDNGPGAEILPALHACHKAMVDGLAAAGIEAYFAVVCLMPKVSDTEGMDIIRVAANMPPDEINGFLAHVARATDDGVMNPTKANVLSLKQAIRLIAMLNDPARVEAELKKRGAH